MGIVRGMAGERVTFDEARAVLRDLELRQPVLDGIAQMLEVTVLDMQRLRDEVAQTRGVNESAATLIRSLAQQIRDEAASDAAAQVDVNELADQLDSAANDLGGAITENDGSDTGGETPPGGEPTP